MVGIIGITASGSSGGTGTVNNLQADDVSTPAPTVSQPQLVHDGLDLDIRVVRALVTVGSGTQDFTVAGFGTPTGIMTLASSDQADGLHTANAGNFPSFGWGFCDGTNEVLAAHAVKDGNTGASTVGRMRTDACAGIVGYADSGVNDLLSFNSFITDGVRLDRASISRTFLLTVVLFKGTDFDMACGVTANDSVVSTLSFKPNVLWANTLGLSGSLPQSTGTIKSSWGLALDTGAGTAQGCQSFTYTSGADPTSSNSRVSTDRVAQQGGGTGWQSDVIAWNSNGFELDTTDVSGDKVAYCAMRFGGGVDLETALSPTGTGNDTKTGLPFQPGFMLWLDTDADALATTEFDGVGLATHVAVADGTNEYLHGYCDQDGVASPTLTNAWTLAAQTIAQAYNDNATVQRYAGTLLAFTADGHTVNYSVATAPARYQIRLAVEAN